MIVVIQKWLQDFGLNMDFTIFLSKSLGFLLILILAIIVDRVTKRFILRGVSHFVAKTKSNWDDALQKHNFFNQFAHLSPVIVLYILIPFVFEGGSKLVFYFQTALMIYMIILAILIIDALLNASHDIYNTFAVSRKVPIKSFIQVTKLLNYFVGGIFIISLLINKSPIYLISGLGAMTAILMFIFKDAILGFIAGIQLAANKMVTIGDWIEMPKYGADGDVIEVGLTTVKVQNFDKTVTMIPTYALISESFKNWRGMKESGGRRIKRAIHIDINAIKFCDDEMINRFQNVQYISQYVQIKKAELENYNKTVDGANQINHRRLTNIGILRAYLVNYLKNHPLINQNMTFLVRQLKPTENGLPIEIYVFCKDNEWSNYEAIQADIFDHLLAIIPEFDLRIFQNPTGSDFRNVMSTALPQQSP
jgi:miniconductance mechanosensitive channel